MSSSVSIFKLAKSRVSHCFHSIYIVDTNRAFSLRDLICGRYGTYHYQAKGEGYVVGKGKEIQRSEAYYQ